MNRNMLHYENGQLHMEGVALESIAGQLDTPFYCYSRGAIEHQVDSCKLAFGRIGASIHYAVKANANLAVLDLMARSGLGADIVSAGELQRVLAAGIDPRRVIFSGVGKRDEELLAALRAGVGQFNVESLPELVQLAELCRENGLRASVSVRVNPDVRAATHRHITTGTRGSKFGIDEEQLETALRMVMDSEGLDLRGLALHIGSQIVDAEPYRQACLKMRDWVQRYRARGFPVTHLDLGGGFGIDYGAGRGLDYEVVADLAQQLLGDLGVEIAVEPGRSLVGPAGILVSRAIYRKEADPTPFLILDAGMNDLLRPALYQASHELLPVRQPVDDRQEQCHVVGPICESSDLFLRDARVPPIAAGDLVVMLQAGAYGAVMASVYNSRPLVAEVMVDGQRFQTVRETISTEQMMAWESVLEQGEETDLDQL
ncbi:MAG: diaminopimelate decarboxylase [Sedimenticola sp.]|nr:diaminopimelate decarboxylase [Sedimenticola sp.]